MKPKASEQRVDPYAWYVLSILFLVYVLNFIDRQILAILAEDIKRDLNLTDADIGFLFGTAFGVFYALFGIPLGRLADSWRRVRLMSLGLALWSAMTAVSGLARSGMALSFTRMGVGIGEATASPAAYSLISDWFPVRLRATALAIYSSGIYIGGGVSLYIGGSIVENWDRSFSPGTAPMGLAGWQAAFMVVGLPGLLLAAVVAFMREPPRGFSEGIAPETAEGHSDGFIAEVLTIIPPLSLIGAAKRGRAALAANMVALICVAGIITCLIQFLGEPPEQWIAVGIGVYAVYSWGSALKQRDEQTFRMTFGSMAFVCIVVAYGLNAFVSYALAGFAPSYARRTFGLSADEVGVLVGLPAAMAGFVGVMGGGRAADWLRQRYASGRPLVVLFGAVVPAFFVVVAFTTTSATMFFVMNVMAVMTSSSALGAAAATTQDLVLPRMRGSATAIFFVGTTLLGLALGPYLAGRISQLTGDLATGVLSLLASVPVACVAAILAWRFVPAAEERKHAMSRAAE
jgi:MFS family permease